MHECAWKAIIILFCGSYYYFELRAQRLSNETWGELDFKMHVQNLWGIFPETLGPKTAYIYSSCFTTTSRLKREYIRKLNPLFPH